MVALFAGDTVAARRAVSSLRYLLVTPIPRSRLLRQKLIVALGLSAAALVLLRRGAAVRVGGLRLGPGPLAAGHLAGDGPGAGAYWRS